MALGKMDCETGFGRDQTQESSFEARASESGHESVTVFMEQRKNAFFILSSLKKKFSIPMITMMPRECAGHRPWGAEEMRLRIAERATILLKISRKSRGGIHTRSQRDPPPPPPEPRNLLGGERLWHLNRRLRLIMRSRAPVEVQKSGTIPTDPSHV